MESWKLAFDPKGRQIFTAGELGGVVGFDVELGSRETDLKTAEIFATAIAYVNSINLSDTKAIFRVQMANS